MLNVDDRVEKDDIVTGCGSESELRRFLENRTVATTIRKQPLSVWLVGVDQYSRYSRKRGATFAQEVLKFVASTIRLSLQGVENLAFRYGEDHFVIVFPGKTSPEAERCARLVIKTMRYRPFLLNGRLSRVTISGGMASFPADAVGPSDLLACASRAWRMARMRQRGSVLQASLVTRTLLRDAALFVVLIGLIIANVVWRCAAAKSRRAPADGPQTVPYVALPPGATMTEADAFDVINLKSGGTLEGIIIRRNAQETEIQPSLQQGKGTIRVRNTDIESVTPRR